MQKLAKCIKMAQSTRLNNSDFKTTHLKYQNPSEKDSTQVLWLGLQNSGNFQDWKLSMGINGNIWELMGINWKFAKLQELGT